MPNRLPSNDGKVYVEHDTPLHMLSSRDHLVHEVISRQAAKYIMVSSDMLPSNGDDTLNSTVSAVFKL